MDLKAESALSTRFAVLFHSPRSPPDTIITLAIALDRHPHSHISTFIEGWEFVLKADRVIRALSALAQEHRLAAFRLLVQAGDDGIAAGTLVEKLGAPASSMSFHLAQLANAGLVTQRRESRSIIYSADYAAMSGLMNYLIENCCGGVPCVDDAACLNDSTIRTA